MSMDAAEERLEPWVDEASLPALVYTRAGVAVPREARERSRAGARRMAEPVRYDAHAFSWRASRYATTLDEAYQLRAGVFMGELGWLAPSPDGRERDRCDPLARHFVVFASQPSATPTTPPEPGALVGYARVLLPRHGFMLQREFAELAPPDGFILDAERAFEVTRFVVRPSHRGRRCVEGRTVVEHLARAIAQWAQARGRTDWYTVCEARYLRALRLRGLRFTQLGHGVEYQPGVEACAALLRLPVASAELRARRIHDYAWYTRGSRA